MNPELFELKDKSKRPSNIVTFTIAENDLPVYVQAARQSGVGLNILARGGETHTFWYENPNGQIGSRPDVDAPGFRTIVMEKRRLAVAVIRPQGVADLGSFWNAIDSIRKPQS